MTNYIVHVEALDGEDELEEAALDESKVGEGLKGLCGPTDIFEHLETSHAYKFTTGKSTAAVHETIETVFKGQNGCALVIRAGHLKSGELHCNAWEFNSTLEGDAQWKSVWKL